MKAAGIFILCFALLTGLVCFALAQEGPTPEGLYFIRGMNAVEDLVQVPGTPYLIGSGMSEGNNPGKLHVIDTEKKDFVSLYPVDSFPDPSNALDSKSYPACPGAPDPKTFGAHGIAIRSDGDGKATVLAINHGREAIEVFKLIMVYITAMGRDMSVPGIRWVGCVPAGENNSLNSVAFLPEGGFVATKFYDLKAGAASIFSGGTTGGVLEWHPETGIKPLPGTDVAGANGIEVSKDGKWIYMAAWGTKEFVRFSRGKGPLKKNVVKLSFHPDNLRWSPDGKLLVAGQNSTPGSPGQFPLFKGWTVIKIDPDTLKFTEIMKDDGRSPMQNVSVALEVNKTLWLGCFAGDRVAYKPEIP
jgi:hypothetical protein